MDRIRAEAKDAAKVARISFLSQFDQMKAVAGTEEKPAAEVKPVDPAVASTEVKPVEPAVASTVKPVTTPVVKPTVSTETLPAHVDTLEVQVAKIKDIIKAIAVPKGFTLKINPNNQVVLQKD